MWRGSSALSERKQHGAGAEVTPLVAVEDLVLVYGRGRHAVTALNRVTFTIPRGSAIGVVGESGSGKSTLARVLVGAVAPTSGTVRIGERSLTTRGRRSRVFMRAAVQYVPQNPYASLSPRRTIGATLAEALDPVRADPRRARDQVVRWLERVELDASASEKYPYQFSGGQRQRIAIARALCVEPEFLIADEITSALDVSIQFEVLQLVEELRAQLGFTMLFISHNLPVVAHLCEEVMVMLHGEIVERGPVREVLGSPTAEYTRELIDAQPGSPRFRELADFTTTTR
jgi:ABC-type dipeptide/oligopeptide/nickel transport system ATPase subunit